MRRRRVLRLFACGALAVCLALIATTRAQTQATDKPFLWRIEGTTPSYLYGTVHAPDARVLALPDVVQRAFDASDVFNAEVPIDDASRQSATTMVLLPTGQNLRSLLGEETFARLVRVIQTLLPAGTPIAGAARMAMALMPLKPWAAIGEVQNLQFLPDLQLGRRPLDEVLYNMAAKDGKTVGGLETVDEQVAIFDVFTNEEQVRMFVAGLDEMEKPTAAGVSHAQEMVDLYLSGDLDRLAVELERQSYFGDPVLNQRLMTRLADDRNGRMADRIAALCARTPARSYFFAVGAAHYIGETGLISQLTKRGFKITRLSAADAASIVRKAAA